MPSFLRTSLLALALITLIISCSDDSKNSSEPNKIVTIIYIAPTNVGIGDTLTITGTNFGSSLGINYVSFAGTYTNNSPSWGDNQLKVIVPFGAESGKLWVVVSGQKSNEVDYIVKQDGFENKPQMILIPAGKFQMGNTGAYSSIFDINPVHQVTISHDFFMSKYEITQKQFEDVMGTNPSNLKGENLPVVQVKWYDATEFCNKLSEIEGLDKCYSGRREEIVCDWNANGYRLPTEAEWEYACKAGTTTDFYSGNLTNEDCSPLDNNLDRIGWYCGNSGEKIHEVGLKMPNSFGMYDMSGNVSEWCWDWFEVYSGGDTTDPSGPSVGLLRVSRDGNFSCPAYFCRSSMNFSDRPNSFHGGLGFRIVSRK